MKTIKSIPTPSMEHLKGIGLPWRTDVEDKQRLQIINAGDFPRDDILAGLGIGSSLLVSSFGITDHAEISKRLALGYFLNNNPELMEFLRKATQNTIPLDGQEFMNYFDQNTQYNPHWANVHKFLELLSNSKGSIPERVEQIRNVLLASLELEDAERAMGGIVTKELEKISVIAGIMTFEAVLERPSEKLYLYDIRHRGSKVHGYQLCSYAYNPDRLKKYPAWTTHWYSLRRWLFGWLVKWFIDCKNKEYKEKAIRALAITEPSKHMIHDIKDAVKCWLERIDWDGLYKKILERTDFLTCGCTLKVMFSYSNQGLIIQVYDLELKGQQEKEKTLKLEFRDFDGYSEDQKVKILKAQHDAACSVAQTVIRYASIHARKIVEKDIKDAFSPLSMPSPQIDLYHKHFAVQTMLMATDLNETYEAAKKHRSFFEHMVFNMKEVASLISILQEKAAKLGEKLCFPDVLSGENVVEFDKILPLHLTNRDDVKRVIPICGIPAINGQVIGITGRHGRGKTVSMLSVTDNLFLAQSGLPLFGTGFRFTPKRVIGLVFIERGEGSTCQLLLQKIKNILEVLKHEDGRNVLLIIDELGTGTQESAGLKMGKQLLIKLSDYGVSLLFSSQIIQLAVYARENLGAECFRVDNRYRILPGIGDGEMMSLMSEISINKLLQ